MPTDLLKRLAAPSAFVDLVRHDRTEFDPAKSGREGTTWTYSCITFVLASGRTIQRVELGPVKPIDDAAAWLRTLDDWQPSSTEKGRRDLTRQAEQRGREVRRLVWDKLAAHLPTDTTTVYLSPRRRPRPPPLGRPARRQARRRPPRPLPAERRAARPFPARTLPG